MSEIPIRGFMVAVALESFLFTFEKFISMEKKDEIRDEVDLQGFFVFAVYFVVVLFTIAFLDKLKVRGRKRFLLDNGLLLVNTMQALCYFSSSFVISLSTYPRYILRVIILILQMFSKANILTVILSIISIQNYETGFYFAFQLIVAETFQAIGGIVYYILPSDGIIILFYYTIIFFFIGSIQYVYNSLSDQHLESDPYSFALWFDMFKVPLFFPGFFAFSLSLAVSFYASSILFKVYPDLSIALVELIILAMTVSYPITLIILYKKFRPLNRKNCIVYGLVFQAFCLIFLIPAYSEGDLVKAIILASPVCGQIGLVLVTVAALPDMIDRASEKLMHVELGVVSDRVCSLVYGALWFGLLIINFFAYIFREFVSFGIGMGLAACGILAFAWFYYRKTMKYKKGKGALNILFDGKEMSEKVDLRNWLN